MTVEKEMTQTNEQVGEVTAPKLSEFNPILVDALGLTRYLHEHSADEAEGE